jgi:hypothetical protein
MSKALCDCGHTHEQCVCPACPKCGYIECYCKELSVFSIEACKVCNRNAFSCECPCTCTDKECDEYHESTV